MSALPPKADIAPIRITSSVRANSAGAVSPREVDVRAIRTVRYSIPK